MKLVRVLYKMRHNRYCDHHEVIVKNETKASIDRKKTKEKKDI